MTILVQKFGGTSLQTPESITQVVSHIQDAIEKKYKLVVVVSALGRKPNPYATDTLLGLINESSGINQKREMDLLMSCGETIAGVVLSNELQNNRIKSITLTGAQAGIITTSEFTQAKIKSVNTARIKQELEDYDVVVVAGFQGQTSSGEITTLGRGGSDTTAAALGVALNAEKVEVFTDVNGIMTADPRMVKSARQLKIVSYSEICDLAYQGAKVIHPNAVEIVMKGNIPLHVRSTYSKEDGTLITNAKIKEIPKQPIIGIAHVPSLSQIKISSNKEKGMYQLRSEVLEIMAGTDFTVDFKNVSSTELLFTVSKAWTKTVVERLIKLGFTPQVTENCAKVSVVGWGMAGGLIASKKLQVLSDNGIGILQSTDSRTASWVLIYEKDLTDAVNVLHDSFNLSNTLKSGIN
ncbi:aspartate kinase [Virgibacillus sp. DJP39]|uniref:aspartate kinase n=1 Tax=Virgibacillus sp. DJP39 TaxID=3409790 RepID=UPI003BB7A54C